MAALTSARCCHPCSQGLYPVVPPDGSSGGLWAKRGIWGRSSGPLGGKASCIWKGQARDICVSGGQLRIPGNNEKARLPRLLKY